jgi:CheY-like chemotaxis protein
VTPSPTSKKQPVSGEARPRRIVVLVCDDNEHTRDLLKRKLEQSAGFTVLRAATIEDALAVLGRQAVDAVVADLRMGGPGAADGGDLLDAVRRWHSGVPCRILATAHPDGHIIAREGGHLFYDKSSPLFELVTMILEAVPRV